MRPYVVALQAVSSLGLLGALTFQTFVLREARERLADAQASIKRYALRVESNELDLANLRAGIANASVIINKQQQVVILASKNARYAESVLDKCVGALRIATGTRQEALDKILAGGRR